MFFLSVCQGLTQNLSGLVAARSFLGLVRDGVIPACLCLVPMCGTGQRKHKMGTLLLLNNLVGRSSSFPGSLSHGTVFLQSPTEGKYTDVRGVRFLSFFIPDFPDFPEEAGRLSPE
ncbi:uncharacterized protein B0H18DRAFT_1120535 [Fomitopsis serialis]|uniref:uncharacterized protein n=1 Tax=Fomitopsis serialis TaxID=139415 RepID=UPI00200857FA|nr:uncharacterized protein B0H18DRAFT_1120535 [Neoantrodia serialis]KAH9923269.1 hypothetical protein B0H18DRAFT_1120535 [Neoantrodia serialis]